MSSCNVCGAELPPRDPISFLCGNCEHFVPPQMMDRYVRAAKAVQISRKQNMGMTDPILVDRLAAAYMTARDVARANARGKAA